MIESETREYELNNLIFQDYEELSSIIHEMTAPNVNKLSDIIEDLIKRNVELALLSKCA